MRKLVNTLQVSAKMAFWGKKCLEEMNGAMMKGI